MRVNKKYVMLTQVSTPQDIQAMQVNELHWRKSRLATCLWGPDTHRDGVKARIVSGIKKSNESTVQTDLS